MTLNVTAALFNIAVLKIRAIFVTEICKVKTNNVEL